MLISRQPRRLHDLLLLSASLLIACFLSQATAEPAKGLSLFNRKTQAASKQAAATTLPAHVRQLVITTTAGWNSHRGRLQVFHKPQTNSKWQAALFQNPVPVLLGSKGLAWGRGSLLNPKGPVKKERDGRAPAGCFSIGTLYGYAPRPPAGTAIPYHQVGKWDAWPDDPANPFYNRHVVIDPRRGIPSWFDKQKMRHGDFAYEWLLEIRHNADPPQAGAGSVIFFHIRRGPDRATSGCTTMEKPKLEKIIQWLRPKGNPQYILLPQAEYQRLKPYWKLPDLK
ncbi:MAG: hypothetical protein L3J39_08600 [Verrucomicrobiales bacterium]|nr:hypothetical protein [Verrucomicrobiales bacterium]